MARQGRCLGHEALLSLRQRRPPWPRAAPRATRAVLAQFCGSEKRATAPPHSPDSSVFFTPPAVPDRHHRSLPTVSVLDPMAETTAEEHPLFNYIRQNELGTDLRLETPFGGRAVSRRRHLLRTAQLQHRGHHPPTPACTHLTSAHLTRAGAVRRLHGERPRALVHRGLRAQRGATDVRQHCMPQRAPTLD